MLSVINNIREIRGRNGFHAIIVICIMLFEKVAWWKTPWKIIRKFILQGIYHVEAKPSSFTRMSLCTLRLPHPYNIVIHGNSTIGEHCTIFQNVTIGVIEEKGPLSPVIGNNVYIGCNSVLLGGVMIEDNVKIGAMSLVLRDVESGTVCGLVK